MGTLGTSHLDSRTLFSSWAEEELLFVCAGSEYVRIEMQNPLFHALSFKKSGRSLLRYLHGMFLERDTTNRPFCFAFLCTAPSRNVTTTTSGVQMIFSTMWRHEHETCD